MPSIDHAKYYPLHSRKENTMEINWWTVLVVWLVVALVALVCSMMGGKGNE